MGMFPMTAPFSVLHCLMKTQSGMTDEEGTTPQGGCGQFGYEANSAGVPTLTTSGQVILECYNHSTPFQLASATT